VTDAAASTARHAYTAESIGTRVHTALRWRTCPFAAVANAVPRAGRVLDAGCGHGLLSLYLAAQASDRRVTGIDVDADKLTVARRAAARAGLDTRVSFEPVDVGWRPGPWWDAIVEVDMLYLLGRSRAMEWLHSAAGALAPGGRLVVKELDVSPPWKARWSRAQEVLATRVLRITEGDDLELVPCAEVTAAMAETGLATEAHRLDHRRLHPHYLAVGTRTLS
jgi:cyclopropane fatty-acyl-phospholipid synthase-like methyltransferase